MFNIGAGEMIVIAIVLLVAVGPEQLPGVIRRVGKTVSEVRSMTDNLRGEFMAGMDEIERAADPSTWASEGKSDVVKPRPTSDAVDNDDAIDEDTADKDDTPDDSASDGPIDSKSEFDEESEAEPETKSPSEPVDTAADKLAQRSERAAERVAQRAAEAEERIAKQSMSIDAVKPESSGNGSGVADTNGMEGSV